MNNEPLISIVDDDQFVRASLRRLIKSFGYAVAVFPSANDFLESPQRDETACLIADVQMPTITGDPHEAVRARALKDGVVCFLGKPFGEGDLSRCVHLALARGKPSDENS